MDFDLDLERQLGWSGAEARGRLSTSRLRIDYDDDEIHEASNWRTMATAGKLVLTSSCMGIRLISVLEIRS